MSPSTTPLVNSEQALIIDCIKYYQSNTNEHSIKNRLSVTIDWSYLEGLSAYHGLKPLLCHVLSSDELRKNVPQDVLSNLEKFYKVNSMWSGLLYERLINIIDTMNSNEISVLAIKGPLMAKHLYGDIAMREFLDLDILVDQEHVRKAKDLLIASGYALDLEMPQGFEDNYESHSYYYNMVFHQDKMPVDLHWSLIPNEYSFSLATEEVMKSSKLSVVEDRELLVMKPEHLLIYLCIHGAKHSWTQLNWVADISQLILTNDIDWDFVIDRTKKLQAVSMVYLGILLARDLFCIKIPEKILNEVKSHKRINTNLNTAYEILFPGEVESYSRKLKTKLFYMSLMSGIKNKLYYLHDFIFKPTYYEWAIVTLPSYLYFLYYLVRPIRLTSKYLNKLVGSIGR